jgi:hypothetical protein
MDDQDKLLEDYLEVDKQISGQNFVCLSVVNPEKVLQKKEEFLFYNYYKLKIQEHIQRLESNLKSVLEKKDEDTNTIQIKEILHFKNNMEKGFEEDTKDFKEFKEKYEDYIFSHSLKVCEEFDKNNKFQTSVRGIKIRGVYDTNREAEVRAKVLQKIDPTFDVFVGQVGYWLPLTFETNHIENNEYANDQLNNLVKSYKDNQDKKDMFYQERTKEMKENAAKEVREHKKKEDTENKIEEHQDTKELQETIENLSMPDPWLERKGNVSSN